MRRPSLLILICMLTLLACTRTPDGPENSVSQSELQKLVGRIPIARGPASGWEDLLLEVYPEPIWVRGVSFQVLSEEGEPEKSELVDQLSVSWVYPEEHAKRFYPERAASPVFFRLDGSSERASLPPGYGIPMWSNEPLALGVRWKNPGLYAKEKTIRVEVSIEFVRDRILKERPKALIPGDLFVAAPLDGESRYDSKKTTEKDKPPRGLKEAEQFTDSNGKVFSQEWLATKGRSEVRFHMGSLSSKLPGGSCVAHSVYRFSPVEELRLRTAAGNFSLPLDLAISQNQFPIKAGDELELVATQQTKRQKQRSSFRVLLYFLHNEFDQFPEMLQ